MRPFQAWGTCIGIFVLDSVPIMHETWVRIKSQGDSPTWPALLWSLPFPLLQERRRAAGSAIAAVARWAAMNAWAFWLYAW